MVMVGNTTSGTVPFVKVLPVGGVVGKFAAVAPSVGVCEVK